MSEDQLRETQLRAYVNRRLTGTPDPEAGADPGDYAPGGAHYVAPDPVHAELYRRALADEVAAEADDGEDDEVEEPGPYDPGALGTFADAAAAALGFTVNEGPPTGQEAFFEAIPEDGRDAIWAAWFESLTPEDQAGVLSGDDVEALESFQRFVQDGALPTLANVADQIEGARLVRQPSSLHAPLNRFRR